MQRKLDELLNDITKYKVVAWGLSLLVLVSLIFSLTNEIGYSIGSLLASLGIIVTVGFVANSGIGRLWQVPTNSESGLITALVLYFILPPVTSSSLALQVALATGIAIASKFIITYNGRHIFNPAACGVVVLGLLGLRHASWWVGNSAMWPFVLILGLLIVYKLRKVYIFAIFAVISVAVSLLVGQNNGIDARDIIDVLITSSPLLFLGTVMLTEPATMPARKKYQIVYVTLVAILYAGQLTVGNFYLYPELALIIGNIYAFAVNPKRNWVLKLVEKRKVSDHVYDYIFEPDVSIKNIPGQYMEWTLAHPKADARGNRRTFTIASSPSESYVHIGVKFYEPSSTYKKALKAMSPGDAIFAGQLAGNFTLPTTKTQKLLFIAGGIGITPFRSMIHSLTDASEPRDIVLLYVVSKESEVMYKDVFDAARELGVRYEIITGTKMSPQLVAKFVPDFIERTAYVSGPSSMVDTITAGLREAGIRRNRIKTDHFSGY